MNTTLTPTREVVPVLAVTEARRLLAHPVMLTGFFLWGLVSTHTVFSESRPLDYFEAVGSALSWVPGLFAVLAAYLVATRDQRAGTGDVLGSLPAREPERVRALCLAALAPGLVALVLNLALAGVLLAQDAFAVGPSPAHLLQGPLNVLGAVLLGVLIAAWAPVPVAPALGVVGLIAFHVAVDGSDAALLAPTVFWARWGPTGGELWDGFVAGSPTWHAVYVAGLCGLAAAGALVRVAPRPHGVRPVVVAGLAALALTVAAGVLQLP